MRFSDLGAWPVTIGVPLLVALALLLMRIFIMGKAQEKRQRANRQQTERLKSLVSAYRVLAGSFQPLRDTETIQDIDRGAIEAALSDILLFGSANQVATAAACANALVDGDVPPLSALVTDLRRALNWAWRHWMKHWPCHNLARYAVAAPNAEMARLEMGSWPDAVEVVAGWVGACCLAAAPQPASIPMTAICAGNLINLRPEQDS